MKIFICYRRHDSIHAAQRVRMFLQLHFGDDAVFIDQEIPPGANWQQALDERLAQCTDVVVLVGDGFVRRLRGNKSAEDLDDDVLVKEIATAIRLGKTIYPFLFGAVDMPSAAQLPEPIKAFAKSQAIFAREPAFDTALAVLANALRTEHGLGQARVGFGATTTPEAGGLSLGQGLALAAASMLGVWFIGSLISLLGALPDDAQRPLQLDFWRGAHYVLTTMLLGLGPYVSYWLVAVMRARARVPIRNFSGLLAAINLGGALVLGGFFLLLSTIPGWRLQPVVLFPATPSLLDYALLALVLLLPGLASVSMAVWEPRVRTLGDRRRAAGILVVNIVGAVVALLELLFAASLLNSTPASDGVDPVAGLGYVLLCPTLSVLYAYGWKFGQKQFGTGERGWEYFFLFSIVVGLMLLCTISLYAYGVAPVFVVL